MFVIIFSILYKGTWPGMTDGEEEVTAHTLLNPLLECAAANCPRRAQEARPTARPLIRTNEPQLTASTRRASERRGGRGAWKYSASLAFSFMYKFKARRHSYSNAAGFENHICDVRGN